MTETTKKLEGDYKTQHKKRVNVSMNRKNDGEKRRMSMHHLNGNATIN